MRAAAVVLAAGSGERLGGVPKATLEIGGGRTFLAAVVEAARSGGCARVVVVVAAPHAEATRAVACAASCDAVVSNAAPERGMASSLAEGLAALDAAQIDVALSWPVDHPCVRPATVEVVLGVARRDRIVVPCHAGRGGHPTAFGADLWTEVTAAIALPGGARGVIGRDPGRVTRLDVDDPGVVMDVDTPDDLRRARALRR